MSPFSRKQRKRVGKGAILLIAILLVSSAVLRLGIGAGSAFADATASDAIAVRHSDAADTAMAGITETLPKTHGASSKVLDALNKRETELAAQERAIEMRAKALEVADKEIARRMREMAQIEQSLRATLTLANGASEGDLAQLTSVYENMKSKDAAALFEAMDPPFAAGFLGRMRPDTAAAIMAGLTPEAAYTISVILAGRNANVPKT